MLVSAFAAFFRSFTRHPLYGLLNLLGLSLGIAAFITLSVFYHFETSFESWSPERPYIYAVGQRVHVPGVPDTPLMITHGGLLDEIRSAWPQTDGTREVSHGATVYRGAQAFDEQVEHVDPNFLTFFGVTALRGNTADALADPSHIVVSAAIARKYFGTIDALGRTLRLKYGERTEEYTVSGVIADLPKNSNMRLDMVCRLSRPSGEGVGPWHQWNRPMLETYLKFRRPGDEAAFAAQLPAFTDRQAASSLPGGVVPHKAIELLLLPLADLHLMNPKLKAAVIALGVVGIVALGLALINYVNLATARAGLRAREVAMRKTLGAHPFMLRLQFLVEATLMMALAFVVALSAVELSLPLINAAGGLSLMPYPTDLLWVLALFGCVLAAGVVAALYPAFVLSAFKPALVLASNRTPGGGRTNGALRAGLAMLQFTAVVVAFILMAGVMLQIHHMQTDDLGFGRDNLLILDGLADGRVTPTEREAFLTAVRALPQVRSASLSDVEPGPYSAFATAQVIRPGHSDNPLQSPGLWQVTVGPDYFTTMQTRLLAGRVFDPQRGEDQIDKGQPGEASRVTNVVISRGAAKVLGFVSPRAAIGQIARVSGPAVSGQIRIVGVVDDVRFTSPEDSIPPKFYVFDIQPEYAVGMVRYRGAGAVAMRLVLARIWRQIDPVVALNVQSAGEKLDPYYRPQRNRSHLFTLGTGVAALIGCVGLYGMAAFNAGRRIREIGIRKVLGASRGRVVGLLLAQFLRPVAVAGLIAWPLGWIALRRWLAQFDDVIDMPLWLFPSAAAAALLIALLTVAGVAFAAASTEPGNALRHE